MMSSSSGFVLNCEVETRSGHLARQAFLGILAELFRLGDQGSNPETSRNDLENREAGEGRGQQAAPVMSDLLHALEKSNERVIEAKEEAVRLVTATKEEVIQAKDETIRQLKNNLLLLTAGRSVEEVHAERKKARQCKKRRQELLEVLDRLNGRWGKRKRRKEILSQLRELETND